MKFYTHRNYISVCIVSNDFHFKPNQSLYRIAFALYIHMYILYNVGHVHLTSTAATRRNMALLSCLSLSIDESLFCSALISFDYIHSRRWVSISTRVNSSSISTRYRHLHCTPSSSERGRRISAMTRDHGAV